MTVNRVLWPLVAFAFGCLAVSVVLTRPTIAQDCKTFDAELAEATAGGFKIHLIPSENLARTVKDVEAVTGDSYGKVTRGFLEFEPGVTTVGLEADGCLFAPIYLQKTPEAGA